MMWARVAEIAIGVWLLASPTVLGQDGADGSWSTNNSICGVAIILVSMISFWPTLRKAHLAEIPIGLWILGFSYFSSTYPPAAVVQSNLLAALFLLNFSIVPSRANVPPDSWRYSRTENKANASASTAR